MTAAAAAATPAGKSPARLSLLDCVGIAVNGIIGSGIFLLPAVVYRHAGGRSPLAWGIVGGLCLLVGLCFAEAASYTDENGGPYRYASLAFGREPGYAVGWIALASTMLSYATVARGFTDNLAVFLHGVAGHEVLVGAALIGALAGANLAGLKPGAWTSDALSIVKVVPLLLFVGAGLFFVDAARFAAPAMPRAGEAVGLLPAAMAGLFACTGFEFVPVPAGETTNPARAIPIALLGGLGGSILLYVLVQVVTVGTSPDAANGFPPLAAAAGHFGGHLAASGMVLAALLSSLGFCAGSAVVGPRYLASFAADGLAPRWLARRRANGTPGVAIVTYAVGAGLLGHLGDFERLADMANLAVVAQYLPTCAALLVLRRRHRDAKPGGFRLPAGPLIPVLAIAACFAFLWQVEAHEWKAGVVIVVVGFALRATQLVRTRPAAR